MSVNTENKRRSVQAYTLGLMRPVADSNVTAGDRRMLAWTYAFATVEDADLEMRRLTSRRERARLKRKFRELLKRDDKEIMQIIAAFLKTL